MLNLYEILKSIQNTMYDTVNHIANITKKLV